MMPTMEELEAELARIKINHDSLYDLYVRTVNTLNEERLEGRLTTKQNILTSLAMSAQSAFPHLFNAKRRWDKAERLYAEGVKRGHYPKENA